MLANSKSPKYVQETLIIFKVCIYQSVCVCVCSNYNETTETNEFEKEWEEHWRNWKKERKEKKDISSILI